MNQFKCLDQIFPTLPNRLCGEVVGISVNLRIDGHRIGVMFGKRKAWYVNASVNAFHLHRDLCKEMRELVGFIDIKERLLQRSKRLLAAAVKRSYYENNKNDVQYFEYDLSISTRTNSILITTDEEIQKSYNERVGLWLLDWTHIPYSFQLGEHA